MPFQDLTSPPPAPARTDPPDIFITKADAFLSWVATFASQLGILIPQLEAMAALVAVAPAYADAGLLALTGKTPAADRLPYFDSASSSALAVLSAAGRALIDDPSADAQLSTLGFSDNGKALVQAANYALMRGLLNLVPGVDVQAYNTKLSALAGVGAAADKLPYFTGAATAATATLTAFARSLLDDADAAAARATLQLGPTPTTQTLGASGSRTWSDGYKETWGTITIGADAYATYPLPIAHTSWVHPQFAVSGRAGNTSYNQNTGITGIEVDGTNKPTGITFWNADDASLTLYVSTRGV